MDVKINENLDYYHILGVPSNASTDEIKTAYKAQALRFHPDTKEKTEEATKQNNDQFLLVKEAYEVLSKPLVRNTYDHRRNILIHRSKGTGEGNYDPNTGTNFAYHYENFALKQELERIEEFKRLNDRVVVQQRSDHWKTIQEKYKTESWQKLSLDEKKLRRAQSVEKSGAFLARKIAPFAIVLTIAGIYAYRHPRKKIENRY